MKTLLAIIKEPGNAEDFIIYSVKLAKDLKFNLHLTFLQEPADFTFGQPPPSPAYAAFLKVQKARAENALSEFKRQIKNLPDDIKGRTSIDYSAEFIDAAIFINDFVKEDKVHMAILQEDDEKAFWSGLSTEMNVINNADCPVWVIPNKARYTAFKEIIYATDYQEEDLITLRSLVKLTHNLSPAITALHITDNNDFEERIKKAGFDEMVQSKINYRKITVRSLKEHKNEHAAQLINGYALNADADLIVLLMENRGFFEKIFSSDPTKKIIRKASLPVLIYRY